MVDVIPYVPIVILVCVIMHELYNKKKNEWTAIQIHVRDIKEKGRGEGGARYGCTQLHIFSPSFGEQRQVDHCKFEDSLL